LLAETGLFFEAGGLWNVNQD